MQAVEHTTRVTPYPQTKLHIPALRLLPCLLIVLALISGFTLVILSIRLLLQTAVPLDPFASVADVLAEQSESDLRERGFSCSATDNYNALTPQVLCKFSPERGIFSTVAIMFVNGNVHNRFVLVRDGALTVGDLVRLWGRPDIHQHGFWGQLEWPGSSDMDITVSYHGRYSLFLPVRSIVFTDGID
jgi:hypothetical protein